MAKSSAADPPAKPQNLAEGNPSIANIVRGADAFELLGQIPELKANLKALEHAIDRQQDEMLRSFDRIESGVREGAERYQRSLDACEARLVKPIDYQRDEIKELREKINGINWKLAIAAGAVMVGSAILTPVLPDLWKIVAHQ